MSAQLIGLMGYAQTGKDTTANVLVEHHGFTRVAFADKLREVAYALDPIVAYTDRGAWGTDVLAPLRLQDVVDQHGWDYAKTRYPEVRALLQRLGTEAGRQVLSPALFGDDSIWVRAALDGLHGDSHWVITDVRFPNEAQAIRERGGWLWRIERNGTGPVNGHASETALDDTPADWIVPNNGTLDDLARNVQLVLNHPDWAKRLPV